MINVPPASYDDTTIAAYLLRCLPSLGQNGQARVAGGGVVFSGCLLFRSSVRYQNCERDIFKADEANSL